VRARHRLQLFSPGIGLKRWLLVLVVGVLLFAFGVFVAAAAIVSYDILGVVGLGFLRDRFFVTGVLVGGSLTAGLAAAYVGLLGVMRFARSSAPGVEKMRSAARLTRGPRVLAVGGGTGLATLLGGLKHHTSNLTAIVTVADDGGSSGLLRRDLGVLPPGDIRNCMVALADDESLMGQLFQYRFRDGDLRGHSFGNLFVAALTEVTGDFERAVQESSSVLKVRGQVLPATLEDVVLFAEVEGGEQVTGQSFITAHDRRPLRVWLEPADAVALPHAVAAIESAELVVLGPGSLFTSVIPNLLVCGVCDALRAARAPVVYVCNVMTQPGETERYSAADHLEALQNHGARGIIDVVVVNDTPASSLLTAAYRRQGAEPVVADDERLRALGVQVVHAEVAGGSDVFRHDPARLADAVLRLVP